MSEPATPRAWSQSSVLAALAVFGLVACGKAVPGSADGEGGGGQAAGGGASTVGGALGGASTVGGASGGTGLSAGQAGTDAVKAALPEASNEELDLLEPLFIDSALIAGADLPELIEMGARIGIARGFAMCRCSAIGDRSAIENLPCARAEVGILNFTRPRPFQLLESQVNPDLARCLQEEAQTLPWFAAALRCELQWYQADGRGWLELCASPSEAGDAFPVAPMQRCAGLDEQMVSQFFETVEQCGGAAYCDDGTRVGSLTLHARCSGSRECPDWADERGCFDIVGYDMPRCGDEVATPYQFCALSSCGAEIPPLCEPEGRWLQCPDGTKLQPEALCNRKDDCADGADERYCFR